MEPAFGRAPEKLAQMYKITVDGFQFKVIQDRRSYMLKARVDESQLPFTQDHIVSLFDYGMLSRITFSKTTDPGVLECSGKRFAMVAMQYLKLTPGIVVCINSTSPSYHYGQDHRIVPTFHRITILSIKDTLVSMHPKVSGVTSSNFKVPKYDLKQIDIGNFIIIKTI